MRAVLRLVVVALLLAPGVVHAQDAKAQALESFNKGRTHYDLGRFDEAIQSFQKAYELDQNPVYLFNIAQSYRQKGEAQRAIFFYKRYLASDPAAKNRESVEKRIRELEDIAKNQADTADKPPPGTLGPDKGGDDEVDDEGDGDDTDADLTMSFNKAHPWRVTAEAGPAFVGLGDGPSVPTQVSVRVGAGYTLAFGKAGVDLGVALTYTPIPYSTDTNESGSGSLFGVVANAGGRYQVAPKIDLRAEAGLGAMWFAGLVEGNPFTENGDEASGPLGAFNLRVGLGVDYRVSGGLVLQASPAVFSYSPAPAGLIEDISAITRFDVLFGLGYAI